VPRAGGGSSPISATEPTTSVTSLALVAQGQAVTLLPRLVRPEAQAGVAVRAIAEGSVHRTVFAATRFADAKRPSVKALAAVRAAAASLGRPAPGQAAA
jgi:DNA-binding transcriptional LysR family regulator